LLPGSVRLITVLRPSPGFGARATRPSEASAATSDVIRRWVTFSDNASAVIVCSPCCSSVRSRRSRM
jgi:hypothetical protein